MSAEIAVVLNCSSNSRQTARRRQCVAEALEAAGLRAEMLCVEHGPRVPDVAQAAARGPYRLVVAGGGDGTMNAVASALAGTDKLMGILPLGTMNHFAKNLQIPLDLPGAASVLRDGSILRVDLGEVNGHLFVNNSTLGVYPSIVRYREQLQRRHGLGKWAAFGWAAVTMLRLHVSLDVRLTTDEQEQRVHTPLLFVGNNEYKLGGLSLGTRATLEAGQLGVFVAQPSGRLWGLRLLLRALVGSTSQAPGVDVIRTRELWVDTPHRRLRVALDGEILTLDTPLHYRSRRKALAVLVPRETASDLEEADSAETRPAAAAEV